MSRRERRALAERLRQVRGERTQREMAAVLGTPQHALSRYERGDHLPGLSFLLTLSRREAVSLNWLLLGRGHRYLRESRRAR